jgi:hypothetical protein
MGGRVSGVGRLYVEAKHALEAAMAPKAALQSANRGFLAYSIFSGSF